MLEVTGGLYDQRREPCGVYIPYGNVGAAIPVLFAFFCTAFGNPLTRAIRLPFLLIRD